jgi:malate dehydrogenase (oxaloacetate-decarboxylating)(NADP+)
VKEAVEILHNDHPEIIVDGEVQGSVAFNSELLKENYPFSTLINNSPNILIFPNLAAGNIAYHLMMELGNSEAVGPILLGLNKSVHVLQLGSSVRQIVNMVAIAAVDAYVKRKKKN